MEIKKIQEISNPSISSVAYNRCLHCNTHWSPRTNECPKCGSKLKFESGVVQTYNFKICLQCESNMAPIQRMPKLRWKITYKRWKTGKNLSNCIQHMLQM